MDLLQQFKQYIQEQQLFNEKDGLLLAVSGGVDSVVLCELCHLAGYQFSIAHCNFQLRGAESDRDEAFVRSLADKYKVALEVQRFDTKAVAALAKTSIEETARNLRYDWFSSLLDEKKTAQWILTAHHADDNIETLLMNFFRGTGIKGLHGILPKQGKILRPLLFARRSELEAFAHERQLEFVTDSTNADSSYTRNYFRNELIPLISERFPAVQENLLNNIKRLGEAELLYRQGLELQLKKLLEYKGDEIHIPVLKLAKCQPLDTILHEIISAYGFTARQVVDVRGLLQSETGKYVQSETHRIIRNRKWLIITPRKSAQSDTILIEANETALSFPGGKIKWRISDFATNEKISTATETAQLDAAQLQFPLLLRRWKQGDYFYPLGMLKKKKLNRFLTDQKLSLPQKENVWVIESDKKIIWVVGMRIDERCKISPRTKKMLQLEWVRDADA